MGEAAPTRLRMPDVYPCDKLADTVQRLTIENEPALRALAALAAPAGAGAAAAAAAVPDGDSSGRAAAGRGGGGGAAAAAPPTLAPGIRLAVARALAAAYPYLRVVGHESAHACVLAAAAAAAGGHGGGAHIVLPLTEPDEPLRSVAGTVVHNVLRHSGARLAVDGPEVAGLVEALRGFTAEVAARAQRRSVAVAAPLAVEERRAGVRAWCGASRHDGRCVCALVSIMCARVMR
jgi:hypothetical protein